MTTTTSRQISTDIQWELPTLNADDVLYRMYATVRDYMEANQLVNGFGNMMIERRGGFIGVEVQIDATTSEVKYIVAANPDMTQSYPLVDYSVARNQLRNHLSSVVVF